MNDMLDFAELLTQYRNARNLSQGQLAKAARLSRTYIYHLEHGLRAAPSPRTMRSIVRALELHGEERHQLIQAFTDLTGEYLEDEPEDPSLFDLNRLSSLLVDNTLFPAHCLDRTWHITAWNHASTDLFEVNNSLLASHHNHLIHLIFDPIYRKRFTPWEELARRLIADFKFQTRSLSFLPEYRDLARHLKRMPDYRRLSEVSETNTVPAPSFVFHMKHSRYGSLALRTAISIFSGSLDYSIVVYLPGNQQTLETFRQYGWQSEPASLNTK